MSELSIVIVNVIALAVAYLYLYPKFAGNDVKKLAWLDCGVGVCVLLVIAPFSWGSPSDYTFFVFDTNWWIFAILSYTLIELPLFYVYVKARGLGADYRDLFKSGGGFTEMASEKSVRKQLSDTKWDGLRTRSALRFLVFGANITMISVYHRAYQYLFGISGVLVGALLGYSVSQDFLNDGPAFDGFNYEINLTWPQINAIFWLIFGYAYMLPSIIMAWRESRRMDRKL